MVALSRHPHTVFVGQSVSYDGAAIHASLEGVPADRRLEMPVIEDFQLGFCIGLALRGKIPICIYPRMDFLVLALNQLVNHLDKLPGFGWFPKVIIRTTVGARKPLDAGPQHTQDHTSAIQRMVTTVRVVQVRTPEEVSKVYNWALISKFSTLIVEKPL